MSNFVQVPRVARRASVFFAMIVAFMVVFAGTSVQAKELFNNTNTQGVIHHPKRPTVFYIHTPHRVTEIQTYHWNNGQGAQPGEISLRGSNGRRYGPFLVRATSGHGGAPNVNWVARPNVVLPPGNYRIIDSQTGTWSYNQASQGSGFAIVRGDAVSTPVSPPTSNCQVGTIFIGNLAYADYSAYATLSATTVPVGGSIVVNTSCLPFDAPVEVLISNPHVRSPFGIPGFALPNASQAGGVVTATLPNWSMFSGRQFVVTIFVRGTPWKAARAGMITIP